MRDQDNQDIIFFPPISVLEFLNQMDKSSLKYWVGFNMVDGIGRVRFLQLENYFSNLENAWLASAGELRKSGLDKFIVDRIVTSRPFVSLDDVMADLEKKQLTVLTYRDAGYPRRLKEIYDYPPLIYIRGELKPQDEVSLAVVGTRHASPYGRQVTEEITCDLATHGITIVSGLASGIDTAAHKSALKAGGRTIAVFACGLDTVYPADNTELAQKYCRAGGYNQRVSTRRQAESGKLPQAQPHIKWIESGGSRHRSGESSGAVITANMALEQNRDVFAVPGNIFSVTSKGTNRLIQDGAKLVTCSKDILEEYNLGNLSHQIEIKDVIPPTETESVLIKHLSPEPIHIDDLCISSGLAIDVVSSTLAMMELKGMIKQVGNMNFTLARELREGYTNSYILNRIKSMEKESLRLTFK